MLRIRLLTVADIPFGMRLKEQAGWNQREADWRRLLDLGPEGCFLAEWDGIPAGTVATCSFGPVAWIALMLVAEPLRRRGIGRALLRHALDHLDIQGVRTIRLDATPAGQPLYEALGFGTEATDIRFQGVLPAAEGVPELSEVRDDVAIEDVAALDYEVTGTDRNRLLRRLAEEHPGALRVVVAPGEMGFVMTRPGAIARQIGPCIATARAGPLLLADVQRRHAGEPVILDVPTDNAPAVALVHSWGLSAMRLLTRMGRGPRIAEDRGRIWASAGPEKG